MQRSHRSTCSGCAFRNKKRCPSNDPNFYWECEPGGGTYYILEEPIQKVSDYDVGMPGWDYTMGTLD